MSLLGESAVKIEDEWGDFSDSCGVVVAFVREAGRFTEAKWAPAIGVGTAVYKRRRKCYTTLSRILLMLG